MHDFLITGASRGLGAALANALLQPGNRLFCTARTRPDDLISRADQMGIPLVFVEMDLARYPDGGAFLDAWQAAQQERAAVSLTFIHNAGMLDPIGLIGQQAASVGIEKAITVNLAAIMMMTARWAALVQDLPIPKKVLSISSGAGRRPVPGWSTYCSTKAAVDRYMECLAAEQATQTYPIKAASLAPGVIDTDMQGHIRSQSKEHFPGLDRFLKLKADDALWSPAHTAAGILAYLAQATFGEEVIDDLRKHWT